jgi:hypothetical protein
MMRFNSPPADGLQLDRCDVCGDKYHRRDLVRTQVEWLYPAHENYFTQSRYDGTLWVCDATDVSTISYGNRCDRARIRVSDANVLSYVNGVQTWSGNGTFRCTSAPVASWSSTTNVIFSCHVGPWERSTTPSLTIAVGDCDTSGGNKTAKATFTTSSAMKVWFTWTGAAANAGQGCYYIDVTNAGYWWIDELQLEADATRTTPGVYVQTSGAISVATADQPSISTRIVCPSCFETVQKKSTKYGTTDESPIDGPVDDYVQEF